MRRRILEISIVLFLCLIVITTSNAKPREFKFGKISPEELSVKRCPIDSNAHAYYFFTKGESTYNFTNGLKLSFKRHFRMKILDKEGFNQATVSIPYYEGNSSKERIYNLKAYTYNMEGGKLVKTELEKKDIYDEATTLHWMQKKFALPNVKEGSVIEVSYEVSSDFYSDLPGWYFQQEVPVLYSYYKVEIPEYFKFSQYQRGYIFARTTPGSSTGIISNGSNGNTNYNNEVYEYEIENVPAFPVAEELTTPKNYMSRVEFELASITIPGSLYKNYTNSWEDVNKVLVDDENFGHRLRNTGFLKESVASVSASATTDMAKMDAAFKLVKGKMKWNETSSCWSSYSLKKAFETGVGNCADINMILVALLKELGLQAYPVVLSTRSNGIIPPTNASIDQLNYVIALCKIDGNSYLMDATEKYSEVNILPDRCLNDKGWIVDEKYSGWETLLKGKKAKESVMYNLTMAPDGSLTGSVSMLYQDHKALRKRVQIKSYESTDKYVEKLEENNSGLKIKDYQISNLDTTSQDLKFTSNVEISDKVENAGDLLYFDPLFFDAYEKNPFSLEKREYPVEYPCPIAEAVIVSITLPEGYKVESYPQGIKLSAIGNSCQYTYKCGVQDNKMTIVSNLQINETIFPGMQYSDLKGFYEQVVKKQLEKVVLKKI